MNIHDAIMMATREEIVMVMAMAGRMKHEYTEEERERIKKVMEWAARGRWLYNECYRTSNFVVRREKRKLV